ncbi:chemotaxis protein CheW [Spirochaeta isovalerica]|uniref:Chemotaxis protein CheW n=1 Tax=Spirochaeta isovalerica TaxID=150 RepID=A0A841RHN0_9SPIO|nr:chemotaxis protein CheW [Spirochaeta isovalerica]MBB6481812.1 purine-binding chemotaxis protein CheW [Spirochaeta isovalerica]
MSENYDNKTRDGAIETGKADDEEEDLLVSQLNMDISNQFVVFSVADEEYGVPILAVQEIISLPNLTRIPGVPKYIPGIINLRGNIIPLYELRIKFKLEKEELDSNTIVIIAETGDENSSRTVGFIVDSVSDVLSITPENLSEKPEFSKNVDARFIEKIGKVGNRMIIIINLTDFFSESEQSVLDNVIQ